MITGILIDPYAISVATVELPGGEPDVAPWDSLVAIYDALSHPTNVVRTLEHVRLSASEFLLVDGHGQVREPQPLRWFKLYGMHHETLAGKGLIIGGAPDGTECSTALNVDEVEWRARFFEVRGAHMISTVQPWGASP